MRKDIDAVAFDLDGTLYPNIQFYSRLIPFVLKEHRLLIALGKARDILRATAPSGDFYDLQAELMAEILKVDDVSSVKEKTERLIYRGWEPIFKKVKLYSHVHEILQACKDSGLKLGLLSDFPLENKINNLKLNGYWDVVLSSEEVHHLKPDPAPFLRLSELFSVPPERILYVGNSVSYDIIGAKGVGMKTAYVKSTYKRLFSRKDGGADFVFTNYKQLFSYILG
jgi:putative hydrolase of the HAD superfamily